MDRKQPEDRSHHPPIGSHHVFMNYDEVTPSVCVSSNSDTSNFLTAGCGYKDRS